MRCSLPDCERKHHARGLCHVHYKRAARAGSLAARAGSLAARPTRTWTSAPGSHGWRDVPGSDGRYLVNDQGQVYSRWQRRPLKGRRVGSGHVRVYLRLPEGPRGRYVHQLVMEAFVGPRPAGMDTRHLDGNPANNALANLAYGTPSENAEAFRALLDGAPGAYRDAVLLNAAAALVVADKVGALTEGVALARVSIDSGAAKSKVDALRRLTNA